MVVTERKSGMLGIYVRVSTVLQVDNTSLDEQVELCKKEAYQLGYSDTDILIYREEGVSGEDIDIRPIMTRLREDIAAGIISHVICTHPDRFSRDLTDKLIVVRELEKNGAEISFTDTEFEKSPEGILFFNIIATIASYELSLIRKRTVRGRERAVRELHKIMPMRVAPFGYDKDDKGQLIINERESAYVKQVYEWYIYENLTTREIGERLYSLGVVPKRGESKNWSASSIGRILTSEIYIGKYYYNRRKTHKIKGKTTKEGKPVRSIHMRDKEEWIEVAVEPIMDQNTFDLAQLQKNKNITNKHVGNQKYQFLLKTILKCGHCGRTWDATTYSGKMDKKTGIKIKYRTYRCPNLNPRKYGPEIHRCPSQTLRAELLENYVWNQIMSLVSDPKLFMEHLKQESGGGTDEIQNRILMLEKESEHREKEKEKIKIMFRREMIAEEEMVADITKINGSLKTLLEEIQKARNQAQIRLVSELTLDKVQIMVKHIQAKMEHPEGLAFEFKRHIVEMLFDEIIIRFDNDDKEKTQLVITSVGTFDKLMQINNNEIAATLEFNDIGVRTQPQDNVVKLPCNYYVIQNRFLIVKVGRHGEKALINL